MNVFTIECKKCGSEVLGTDPIETENASLVCNKNYCNGKMIKQD